MVHELFEGVFDCGRVSLQGGADDAHTLFFGDIEAAGGLEDGLV